MRPCTLITAVSPDKAPVTPNEKLSLVDARTWKPPPKPTSTDPNPSSYADRPPARVQVSFDCRYKSGSEAIADNPLRRLLIPSVFVPIAALLRLMACELTAIPRAFVLMKFAFAAIFEVLAPIAVALDVIVEESVLIVEVQT